jgi:hypothetical protein
MLTRGWSGEAEPGGIPCGLNEVIVSTWTPTPVTSLLANEWGVEQVGYQDTRVGKGHARCKFYH